MYIFRLNNINKQQNKWMNFFSLIHTFIPVKTSSDFISIFFTFSLAMQDEAKCRFDAIVRTLNLLFQTFWQFYKTPRTTWCVLSLIGTYTSQVALKWKSSHNKTFISVTLYCYAHCMLFTITFVAKILAIRAEINDMKYCVKELKKKNPSVLQKMRFLTERWYNM